MSLDPSIKAIGFDMDGTVMCTAIDYGALKACVVDTMAQYGVPREILQGVHYKIALDNGYRWFDDHSMGDVKEEVKEIIGDRCTALEMENSSVARPFPGAEDLLDRLHRMGYRTGILTRGSRRYAEYILGMYGLTDCFDAIVARDDYDEESDAKPAPIAMKHLGDAMGGIEPENILYIGDGIVDLMTAARAGSPFIAVTSGHTDAEEWRAQAAAFFRQEPHTGYSAETLVIMDSVAGLTDMLRSETVVEAVRFPVGVPEPF